VVDERREGPGLDLGRRAFLEGELLEALVGHLLAALLAVAAAAGSLGGLGLLLLVARGSRQLLHRGEHAVLNEEQTRVGLYLLCVERQLLVQQRDCAWGGDK
jgi:hypothetical protein